MHLSPNQLETLRAVADALVPGIPPDAGSQTTSNDEQRKFWLRSASDFALAEKIALALDYLPPEQQQEFTQLLDLLGSPLLGMTWIGPLKSAHNLTLQQRERMLQRWSASRIGLFRQGFQALKKITMFLYYGYSDESETNPSWSAIGYPGPLSKPPLAENVARPITPLHLHQNTTLSCDVVVIGSGAGGSVVAGELAEAGFDVIVIEKGDYAAEDNFTQREAAMTGAYYEAGGAYATKDGSVSIFAGSCLGGGTTINWSGALRTPDYVLEQWAHDHANPHFLSHEYQRSFDAVEAATFVGTGECVHNVQNAALERGAKALGYNNEVIPRNANGCLAAHGCQECGYCSLGCLHGTKMGGLKTYLARAAAEGARFLVNTEVEHILIAHGEAVGVEAVTMTERGAVTVTVKANIVVAAAGAIHTPALLIRSGLQHEHIGRHLHLHPTVSVAGVYDEAVNAWWGNMMTAVSNEFTRQSGTWGVKLETPPIHSGLLAMALAWQSGKAHKATMLRASHVGGFIVLTRDRDGDGRITTNKRGRPVAEYRISDFDLRHLQRGIAEATRIHRAAGARAIVLPHNHTATFEKGSDNGNWTALDNQLSTLDRLPWRANDFPLFSAHQMGTCRMGGNRSTHPVSPEGETYEVKNLFVADSSPFPEASGANPMLSIQTMAHYTAQGIKARFGNLVHHSQVQSVQFASVENNY
jgi:choline dehydrogenase-like flavoprotein